MEPSRESRGVDSVYCLCSSVGVLLGLWMSAAVVEKDVASYYGLRVHWGGYLSCLMISVGKGTGTIILLSHALYC